MIIQVQIRVAGDFRLWEGIPGHVVEVEQPGGERAAAWAFALETEQDVLEVRWTYPGSLQGHYVQGLGADSDDHFCQQPRPWAATTVDLTGFGG